MARNNTAEFARFGPLVASYRDHFDFTLLFEETILSSLPSALAFVAAVSRVVQLWRRPRQLRAKGLQYTKQLALSCYACIQLVLVISWSVQAPALSSSALLASSLSLVNAFTFCLLSYLEHARSIKPSSILLVYFFFTAVFDVFRLRTLWSVWPASTITKLLTASTALKFLVLVVEASEKTRWLPIHFQHQRPEETSSILNRGVFFWLNRLMLTGARTVLLPEQLFELDPKLSADTLSPPFIRAWQAARHAKSKNSILRAILTTLKWELVRPIFPRVILLVLTICQPLLLQRFLRFLDSPPETEAVSVGRGLVAAYALVYFGMAVSTGFYWHSHYRFLTMLRGCLISAINWQTGRLDVQSVNDPKTALSLMSTDLEQILAGLSTIHDFWANILQVIFATILLSVQLGVAAVVPVVTGLACAAGTAWTTKASGSRQAKWMAAVDERVSLIASYIPGMKEVKMKGLSDILTRMTQDLRTRELKFAAHFRWVILYVVGLAHIPEYISPSATFLVFFLKSDRAGQAFDSTRAFTSLSLIIILAAPLNRIFQSSPGLFGAFACIRRIEEYICADEQKDFRDKFPSSSFTRSDSDPVLVEAPDVIELADRSGDRRQQISMSLYPAVRITDGNFGWKAGQDILHDVSLTIPSGGLTCVVGPVASGKSTFCKALLGETRAPRGKLEINLVTQGIAFCDQTAHLINQSIKDNIIGFAPMEQEWYNLVVWASALTEDIAVLPDKDDTLIGTNGVNLSGGQRHKVALARALYSRHKILVLDDIFSGLDAGSADHVFRHAVGPKGLARKHQVTVVFATHAVKFLPHADLIIVLNDRGEITDQGSYSDLRYHSSYIQSQSIADVSHDADDEAQLVPDTGDRYDKVVNDNAIATAANDSARLTGDFAVYRYYLSAAGKLTVVLLLLFGVLSTSWANISVVWLKIWTEATAGEGSHAHGRYLGVYAVFQVFALVFLLLLAYVSIIIVVNRAGTELHRRSLMTLMNAPLSMFSKTDVGVLTNRFSQDMTLIDNELAFGILNLVFTTLMVSGQAINIVVSSPWTGLTLPVVLGVLYLIQKFYLRTSRQLRFLDLEAKSPLYTHFLEYIIGLATIRAFNWTQENFNRGQKLLEDSQKPAYLLYMIQRWLWFVLETVIACLAAIIAGLAVIQRSSSSSAGVALTQLMGLNLALKYLILTWTEVETCIGAVSRMKSFKEQTPSEHKAHETQDPPEGWPARGRIEFRGVGASYDAEHQDRLALKDLNFMVEPGRKVGICGRSGSGKSSTILSLFRMLELTTGSILIDNVDVSACRRDAIRAGLNALPQHPFFLHGTVRVNLDPTGSRSDEELMQALAKVNLDHVLTARGGLDAELKPEVLSHGQRQLFALAGAILRRSKVVVLDEVTSNVDSATDASMQRIIREEFRDSTVIAVAHRLDTIADFDTVIVMDQGRVVETGNPRELLATTSSRFRKLWDTGSGAGRPQGSTANADARAGTNATT